MNNKKLLVASPDQFGYSTTIFKHCEYASKHYDITYIGWEYNKPRFELPNVHVQYVSTSGNVFVRNFRFLKRCSKELRKGNYTVFLNYIRGVSALKVFNPKVNFLIYVDTLYAEQGKLKRFLFDLLLRIELTFFRNIALISKGMAKRLYLRKYSILPIGGGDFSSNTRVMNKLSLIYVGTLGNRNILQCVKGFHKYLRQNSKTAPNFTIIGNAPEKNLNEIKTYIKENKLEAYIHTPGYIAQNKLKSFFEKATVGVSYVPLYDFYQYQPPTKTYEYLVSGLPVLATNTDSNAEIITKGNGILIEDNVDAFCQGLKLMNESLSKFDSAKIKQESYIYQWDYVLENYLAPFLGIKR